MKYCGGQKTEKSQINSGGFMNLHKENQAENVEERSSNQIGRVRWQKVCKQFI